MLIFEIICYYINKESLKGKMEIIMKYILLLRGINISGKNKIAMSKLKENLEDLGYQNVITYLNSGNVVLEAGDASKDKIAKEVYEMIKDKFQLIIPVYIIEVDELKELLDNHPSWWCTENKEIYNNIIFIIPPCTYKEVYSLLGEPNNELEKIKQYKNNIFWSYDLKEHRKTKWWSKTASSDIRDMITIRTANTVKKLLEICLK